VLGDWIAGKDRNLTAIFITHGHGDHWFAAGPPAERFAQMRANAATRPLLWDKLAYYIDDRTRRISVAVPGTDGAAVGDLRDVVAGSRGG
jgi:glyoxylase-like metal-dependent hydrolase (beta-lactamase superfamily II)